MGLDMYLSAHKYVGDWKHSPKEEKDAYKKVMTGAGMPGFRCDGAPSVSVNVTVAYWRKANHIHAWFVEKTQEGKDECQESYVSREQLAELVAECKRILTTVETVEGDVSNGTTYYLDGRVEHNTVRGRVVAQKRIAEARIPRSQVDPYPQSQLECCIPKKMQYTWFPRSQENKLFPLLTRYQSLQIDVQPTFQTAPNNNHFEQATFDRRATLDYQC